MNALINYLGTISDLNSILKKNNSLNKEIEIEEKLEENIVQKTSSILKSIASKITLERFPANRIIFKEGDKGDKFYIIVKGKVNIIKMIEENVYLSEEEYLAYLEKLKSHKEKFLLQKVIATNLAVYPVPNFSYSKNILRLKKSILVDEINIFGAQSLFPSLSNEINEIKHEREENRTPGVDLNYVSLEDYLIRTNLSDVYNEKYANNRKEVRVPIYKHIKTLYSGDSFGEKALDSYAKKRMASVLSADECYIGVLIKKDYETSLKELSEKSRRVHINSILSSALFYGQKFTNFENTLFNYFVFMKINHGNILLEQNSSPSEIYLIREGEFEVTFKLSIKDLIKIIDYFGGIVSYESIELELIKGKKLILISNVLLYLILRSLCKSI